MGSPAPVTAASSVLERLPVSRWHWRLVVLVGIGTFFDLYEVFLGGVLAPVLAKEFGLGTLGKSMVIAAGFAGMFIGANVLSIAADRLGRRRVFILNLLVYSVFSFAAAFSPNIETFLVLRVIAGIGLGAELVLVDTYLAEFMPAKSRGRMTAWAYTIGFLGVPIAALLGGRLVARQRVPRHRRVAVAAAVRRPGRGVHHGCPHDAAGVAALAGEPRPPRRGARGRRIGGGEGRARHDRLLISPSLTSAASAGDDAPSVAQALRIAFRDYRKRTVMLVIFQILQTVAYYGFGTLAPLVLVSKGFEVTESLGYAALAFAGYPLGSLHFGPAGRTVRAQASDHRLGTGNRRVRHRVRRIDERRGDRDRGLPAHGRVQHLLQRLPHLPGRDLPDRDPQHGKRHLLLAVPRDLDRHAVRRRARPRGARTGGGLLRIGGADRAAVPRRRPARPA